jgi:hypothetical protein
MLLVTYKEECSRVMQRMEPIFGAVQGEETANPLKLRAIAGTREGESNKGS